EPIRIPRPEPDGDAALRAPGRGGSSRLRPLRLDRAVHGRAEPHGVTRAPRIRPGAPDPIRFAVRDEADHRGAHRQHEAGRDGAGLLHAHPLRPSVLERQLQRVAARNSCAGPWQPSLDLQLNWHPTWFGTDRRLTVSLLTVNLLGVLDQWWHGAAHRLGCGHATTTDPVLLYVRGFDPATRRFRYAVNGRFGSLQSAGGGIIVPFQIALQGRLTLGPIAGGERARKASAQTPDD